MTTVAVMQPYFFPYAGYFRLLAAADLFVIYDCVQFPRRGWVHRNRLPDRAGEARWLTLPLVKAARSARIDEMELPADARARLETQLARFPALARAHEHHEPLLSTVLAVGGGRLVDYLEACLRAACERIGLTTPMIRSSALQIPADLTGADRVLAIAEMVGARRYVNAPGGADLYDAERFAARGITLRFLPDYPGPPWSVLGRLLDEPAGALAGEIRATL